MFANESTSVASLSPEYDAGLDGVIEPFLLGHLQSPFGQWLASVTLNFIRHDSSFRITPHSMPFWGQVDP